jgi:aminoglycoside/choline kinase family phosphotransferase
MHRDMQSRNIMVKNNRVCFIDFQGARSGPLQYDLASLLIDPYVNLKDKIREELLHYAMEKLKLSRDKKENFLQCYHYCSLTRNMQFLGAFSFLSQIKKRKKFEQYIPDSIQSLKQIITDLNMDKKIPKLSKLAQSI